MHGPSRVLIAPHASTPPRVPAPATSRTAFVIRHLFQAITRPLQTGRLFPWVFCLLAALFFVGDALLCPDHFYTSLFFLFFGCTAACYHYVI
jgi:hypothetical protein